MMMHRLFLTFLISISAVLANEPASPTSNPEATSQTDKAIDIGIVGDSTVSDYPTERTKRRGWGQLLPEFLTPHTTVMNEALSGMSTKTFPAERWQKMIQAHPTFILIQFGHNDSHGAGKPESTDAATDYRDNLRRYIKEAREAGSVPILVTPVQRRLFASEHQLKAQGLLASYAEAMRIVAQETSTPLVDLHKSSTELFNRLGEEATAPFTMNENERSGKTGEDRTHFTEVGAREVARLVAQDLKNLDPRLTTMVLIEP